MLICNEVSKTYGKYQALQKLSLQIKQGECLALFGANGSGKSTLLSILSGSAMPDTGEVYLTQENDKEDVPSDSAEQKLNIRTHAKKVAYVPQNIVLFEELTVWENLLAWSDKALRQSKDQAEWLCNCLEMNSFRKKRVDRLSGGQRRRVNIAVSLMNDFDYILLDEPLSGMDTIGESILKDLLAHYKQQMKGIVIAEHHISYVLPFSDHVMELKEGVLQFEGTPEAYYEMVQPTSI